MAEQPEPTGYPDSWKTKWIRDLERQRAEQKLVDAAVKEAENDG